MDFAIALENQPEQRADAAVSRDWVGGRNPNGGVLGKPSAQEAGVALFKIGDEGQTARLDQPVELLNSDAFAYSYVFELLTNE